MHIYTTVHRPMQAMHSDCWRDSQQLYRGTQRFASGEMVSHLQCKKMCTDMGMRRGVNVLIENKNAVYANKLESDTSEYMYIQLYI